MATKKLDVESHSLVPEHTKLSEKEKAALLALYKIELLNLPQIRKKDPAIKSLSPRAGDVIKIQRKSPTAGTAIFYRVVVHA